MQRKLLALVVAALVALGVAPMAAQAATPTYSFGVVCGTDGFTVNWSGENLPQHTYVDLTWYNDGAFVNEDLVHFEDGTSGQLSYGYLYDLTLAAGTDEYFGGPFTNIDELHNLDGAYTDQAACEALVNSTTTTTTIPDAGFVDVSSGSVFFDDVNYIAYYGVTTGVGGGRFDPLGEVSRWQMALFLDRVWEAVGFSLPAPSGSFSDIGDLPAEYQDAIRSLAALGVTQGTGDGRFNPDGEVSRWQMALFLVRVLDLAGVTLPSGANQGFSDIGSLDVSYQMAINQLFQLGITTGTSASTFGPNGVVTREQMAAFLARTMRLIQQ
jgi:hypothetical protein